MTYINPRIDVAFKKLFGVDENRDLLMALINAIVSKEDEVSNIQLLNPYNCRSFKNDKLSVLDVKARGNSGKLYNIEIQISNEADYDKRALFYWAKLYTEQLHKGAEYSSLNKSIGIHILNFLSIPGIKRYHNIFQLREKVNGFHFFSDIELHTIELTKFDIVNGELKDFLPRIRTSLDKWVMLLTRYDLITKETLPKELNDPNLVKALDVLEFMNFNKFERDAYDSHMKWLMIEASTLKKVKEESYSEGLETGRNAGRNEEKKNVAIRLLEQNFDLSFIAAMTKLPMPEILKLKTDKY